MRAFRVVGKYPIHDDSGNIAHTDISITTTAGMPCGYTERVLGNHVNKSDEELIELCRNQHFKSEYSDRAMAESVQKIDELDLRVKKYETLGEELKKAIDKANAATVANKETVDKAVTELTELVAGAMSAMLPQMPEGVEEDGETYEETN